MRIPRTWYRSRFPADNDLKSQQAAGYLRQAFKDEIKLPDYLGRIWLTSIIAALIMCVQAAWHDGAFYLILLMPVDGQWHARDVNGTLYVDTWCTILVNALQVGLGTWGIFLLALGIKRILTAHKYFVGCLSLGIAFCGFSYCLPAISQPLLQMIVDCLPFLVT